jgi:hypothetical protein
VLVIVKYCCKLNPNNRPAHKLLYAYSVMFLKEYFIHQASCVLHFSLCLCHQNFFLMRCSVSFYPLTREGTNLLKGIAIILIALHNYYRWISPMTGENEFEFSRLATINNYILVRSNLLEVVHAFFSFLGHYGVQAFIVISAYGLTRSYKRDTKVMESFFFTGSISCTLHSGLQQ